MGFRAGARKKRRVFERSAKPQAEHDETPRATCWPRGELSFGDYFAALFASAGSLPSTQAPPSFWYSGGSIELPVSPPVQPAIWFGLPRFLLRSSQRFAQLASATTGL